MRYGDNKSLPWANAAGHVIEDLTENARKGAPRIFLCIAVEDKVMHGTLFYESVFFCHNKLSKHGMSLICTYLKYKFCIF